MFPFDKLFPAEGAVGDWAAFYDIMARTLPIWLPFALAFVFFEIWVKYKRAEFLRKIPHVLLEIKVPREISKSPLAMELFLNALHQTIGESTWYDRYILGKVRAQFSLELVSLEGQVRFFIRTRKYLKKYVETQLYSQYPSAEIHEVPDYVLNVPYAREGSAWSIFGAEFILARPNPYPIQTYIDYRLDKDPKEELKVDPITPLIEYFGDLGKGEQLWMQIILRANKGKSDPTSYWAKTSSWQEEGQKIIEEIFEKAKERFGPAPTESDERDSRFSILTDGEREIMKAIDRKVAKLGFDCGIRTLYLAKKENFNPDNISGLFGTVKQYSSNNLNKFTVRLHTDVDYPWQKYINIPLEPVSRGAPFISLKGRREFYVKWKLFDAYRRRSWFFPPYERRPFVLNSEELATIYHFPGRVSETPTFERVESKKSEPPANLPF